MNQMGYSKFLAVLILAVAVVMTVAPRVAVLADAQTPTLPCTVSLRPCAPYLKGGTPSGACCASMAEAVKSQMQCLCTLYTTPGMLASFGTNVSQAMGLTARCNITATTCGQAPAPAPTPTPALTPSPTPAPTSTSPTSTPTSYLQPSPATTGKSHKSGADRIAWAGLRCLSLLWVSIMLY